jgi:hypothetical protein
MTPCRIRVSGRQTRLQFGFPSRTERQQGNWPRPTASLSEKISALIRIAGLYLPTGATRERPQVVRRPLPFFFRRHV